MHFTNNNRHSDVQKPHFNIMVRLRHQIFHFVSTLQQYVQSQLSHVSWCRFLHSLKHKVKDLTDLDIVHMDNLNDSQRICFLSDDMKQIAEIIQIILQCALDFRSFVVPNKSAVNIAQVLEKTYTITKAKGFSTACIIKLSNQVGLEAINLA
ncbi:hypothetical protein Lser_V15G42162 [Lactuca serriola]